ncbi:MAG TPA: glycerol-3-phosphate dehydrogenase/oxidase [Myxococcota bacterium]|nr:glycerol-3-phosphate dehydrogenase/oxidase [Myxococcota bacterium]
MTPPRWDEATRTRALADAAAGEPFDLLVIGGGITGAAVLRDAASRGLRAFLVERADFASGTSSRSSKMIHGGLRYLGEGQLRVTAEACRERDRLVALHPNLVERTPFLFPCFEGGKVTPWQIHAAMWIYAGMAGFRRSARFHTVDADEARRFSSDLRRDGYRTGAVYFDGQTDDARLVLETIRSARALGAEAANHAEVTELIFDAGRVAGARVRDRCTGAEHAIRAHAVVNAAGPSLANVRGLDPGAEPESLRPAKGVHLVLRGSRVHAAGAVAFEAADRRQLFLAPWHDLWLLGTTDDFSDEVDEPVVTIDEVHYLLDAANAAFPGVGLTTNDIVSVYAGVRPLVAPADAAAPPSSVSREHQIYEDPSGLISAAGGKLTTHRAMGESLVDRVVRALPAARRRAAGPSRTRSLPLRDDAFDGAALAAGLESRFGIEALRAGHLVRQYGREAEALVAEAPAEQREAIGTSRYTWAEIPWCMRSECAVTLCDLLEHRVRMAYFAPGQGLPQLGEIARLAAEAAGWDDARVRSEADAYRATVRRRYQIAPSRGAALGGDAAAGARREGASAA